MLIIKSSNDKKKLYKNAYTLTQKQQNSKKWDSRIEIRQVIFPQVWKAQEKEQNITKPLSCSYTIKRTFGSLAGIKNCDAIHSIKDTEQVQYIVSNAALLPLP